MLIKQTFTDTDGQVYTYTSSVPFTLSFALQSAPLDHEANARALADAYGQQLLTALTPQVATTNSAGIEGKLLAEFAEVRTFRDGTGTTLAVAANLKILRTLCRVAILLGRLALKRYDAQT